MPVVLSVSDQRVRKEVMKEGTNGQIIQSDAPLIKKENATHGRVTLCILSHKQNGPNHLSIY